MKWVAVVVGIAVAGCRVEADPGPVDMSGWEGALTLLLVNLANGADDAYRTAEARERQAALVAASGAELVAMLEVDLHVARSGRADCAREVARLACDVGEPEYSPDGVRLCTGADGDLVFAVGLSGEAALASASAPPGLRSLPARPGEAAYGNALAVLGAARVIDAYAVVLPTRPDAPGAEPLDAALGAAGPDDPARAELAARNQALRATAPTEPRVALVARLRRDGRPLSVIVTHLDNEGRDGLRLLQLERVVAVARSEKLGPPARDVVIAGDFNQRMRASAVLLEPAGFWCAWPRRDEKGLRGVDQIWIGDGVGVLDASGVATRGVSDHPYAGRVTFR